MDGTVVPILIVLTPKEMVWDWAAKMIRITEPMVWVVVNTESPKAHGHRGQS